MNRTFTKRVRLTNYFEWWMHEYKLHTVRPVTYRKYEMTLLSLEKLVPTLSLGELSYPVYQDLVNRYGEKHQMATLHTFHGHLKACLLDAMDAGLVDRRIFRHVVLHAKPNRRRHLKYLNLLDLKRLLKVLQLDDPWSLDWIYLLVAKTGLRVSEALGLTVDDFDFNLNQLTIWRTWNYKSYTGFDLTKNSSSRRVIDIDPLTSEMFKKLIEQRSKASFWDNELPIFVQNKRLYLSTINYRLKRRCEEAGVAVISMHGLRHTHASLLIYDGVSLGSVAERLGHANTITTQKTYVHVVKELAQRDQLKIIENMIKLS